MDAVPNKAEPRLRLLTPEQAGGWLQPHTLAVNEIGLAFLRAARQRQEGFDVQSWRHEIAHDIKLGRDQHRTRLRYRFLELDRATLPIEDLLAKLGRYVDLRRCWRDYWQAGDSERARHAHLAVSVPRLGVPAGRVRRFGRGNPERRMRTVMTLCRRDSEIMYDAAWFSFALFDELVASGPFAPVFRRLEGASLVNWLGEPPDVERQAA